MIPTLDTPMHGAHAITGQAVIPHRRRVGDILFKMVSLYFQVDSLEVERTLVVCDQVFQDIACISHTIDSKIGLGTRKA